MANFFYFGFINKLLPLASLHANPTEGEPMQSPAWFQQMLTHLLNDAFGPKNKEEETLLVIVMNSGSWDMLALATCDDWQFRTQQVLTNGTWAKELISAATVVRNLTNASMTIWRNLPDVAESRTEKQAHMRKDAVTNPFTHNNSVLLNDAGMKVAQGVLNLPILDWRGSIVGREEELTDGGGWHV